MTISVCGSGGCSSGCRSSSDGGSCCLATDVGGSVTMLVLIGGTGLVGDCGVCTC